LMRGAMAVRRIETLVQLTLESDGGGGRGLRFGL
jgi:hypothetical protein